MFRFIDGKQTVATFEQVEQLFHDKFIGEFGNISITQWRASFEYQCLYPAMQMSVETGSITREALSLAMKAPEFTNAIIHRPAIVYSRVPERFNELGFDATIKKATASSSGVIEIAVDYIPTPEDNEKIKNIIAKEMLVVGSYMAGDITEVFTLSNGQLIDVQWTASIKTPIKFKVAFVIDKSSKHPTQTVDEITESFIANFHGDSLMGNPIRPQSYYQITTDAPWASSIITSYSLDDGATWLTDVMNTDFNKKYIPTLNKSEVSIS